MHDNMSFNFSLLTWHESVCPHKTTHAASTLSNDPSAVTCTSRRALKTSFTGNTTLDRGTVPVLLAEVDFSIDNASEESCDRRLGWGASFK